MGGSTRPTFEEGTETIFGWVQERWQWILGGAMLIAALAGGFALYERNQAQKAIRGERALFEAQRAALSGNPALAQSDLRKVRVRYDGTAAADRAAIVLAQLLYDQRKYAEGIETLTPVVGSKLVGSAAEGLIAIGYEEQQKLKEAAAHYQKASAAAAFDLDKANYLANAARALGRAGDVAAAKALWTELAADAEGPLAGEARVRIGELMARSVSKS